MLTPLLLLPLILSLPGDAIQDSQPTSQPVQGSEPPAKGEAKPAVVQEVPEVAEEKQPKAEADVQPLPKARLGPKRLSGGRTIRVKPKATVEPTLPVVDLTPPHDATSGNPDPTPTTNADEVKPTDSPAAVPPGKQGSPFDRNPFLTGPVDPFATLVAGVLPPRTAPGAAKLWNEVVNAAKAETPAGEVRRPPITSFELKFEITVRDPAGGHNEATTRVRYLAPHFVRFQLAESTELGFGPDGYWSKDIDQTPVDISRREYAESKRRVQDVRTTAKNFLALAEPGNLRILNLAKDQGPPANQPPGAAKRLDAMDWLVLESPDFDLSAGTAIAADAGPRLYRAYIGVDRQTHHVLEAMVLEVKDGEVRPATATWLTMGDRLMLDGISFPGSILIHRSIPADTTVLGSLAFTFPKRPSEELYLIEGKLLTDFGPDDFRVK